MIKGAEETKYVAMEYKDITLFGNLNPNAVALDGGADIADKRGFLLLPPVGQGTTASSRIGNFITPVKCRVTVHYYYVNTPVTETQDVNAVALAQDVVIRQMVFSPKSIRRWAEYATSPTAIHGYKRILPQLLETGDGTLQSANSANIFNLDYPLTNEIVTKHKGCKLIHMKKGSGLNNSLAQVNVGNTRTHYTTSFSVKLPKKLKYPDGAEGNFPDNACPILASYGATIRNSNALTYDQIQAPYLPPTATSLPQHPLIQWAYRVELWFKDA